ncbi:MAG: MBL fold metallo-hydrolase [Chloroflexi bacterium]|nr:MBL fold metallo-hydrolase [Chloroflexota bacterium]MBM4454108.1 MBL fold metallo-hydrolase [Chloroflexota bacterium]
MVSRFSGYYNSVQLVDGLHCYVWQGRGNNCNSCLFTNVLRGERPHVLVDPGHVTNEFSEPCFDYLVKAMGKDGFKVDDIGLIINTHTHPDHCEANEKIVEKSGAWVTLSGEEDEFRNTLGKKFYSMFRMKMPEFTPLFYLEEGGLNLGAMDKVQLQVFLAPGHSPGSVCLYWPKEKILITGDVVFYGSIGRTDFPSGSLSQLKQSIDRLSQLDVECLVPGHSTELGSIVKGKKNVERNFQAVKLFV